MWKSLNFDTVQSHCVNEELFERGEVSNRDLGLKKLHGLLEFT